MARKRLALSNAADQSAQCGAETSVANAAELIVMGEQLASAGDLTRAEELARQVLKQDAGNSEAYDLLGYLSFSVGQTAQAVEYFRQAVDLNAANLGAGKNLVNALAAHNRPAEAADALRRLRSIAPDDPELLAMAAQVPGGHAGDRGGAVGRAPVSSSSPESYWVERGAGVIGRQTHESLMKLRMLDVFELIFRAITSLGVTSVADLGCNVSNLGRLLHYWGYPGEYSGVDSNPYALQEARRATEEEGASYSFYNRNIRDLQFPDATFECVVMKDVLEHMEDFRPLVSEAARVASRYVIIANFIPWTEGDQILRRTPGGYYLNLYKRSEVYAFARDHGLQVEAVFSAMEKDPFERPNEVVVFAKGAPAPEILTRCSSGSAAEDKP